MISLIPLDYCRYARVISERTQYKVDPCYPLKLERLKASPQMILISLGQARFEIGDFIASISQAISSNTFAKPPRM
jgi:hypothetical protein